MKIGLMNKAMLVILSEFAFFYILLPVIVIVSTVKTGGADYFIWNYDLNKKAIPVAILSSVDDLLIQFPDGDISYQIKFAADFIREGVIADWVLNLWPPGMPGLYGLIIKFTGAEQFVLKMIVLSVFLNSLMLFCVYKSIFRGKVSPIGMVACGLPVVYASSAGFQLFSSDFYCFIFLGFVAAQIFDGESNLLRRVLLIALGSALLAYFRSFYFEFIKLLTFSGVVIMLVSLMTTCIKQGWPAGLRNTFRCKRFVFVSLAIALTWLFLCPWKYYLISHDKPFEWTVSDQVWAAQWRLDLPYFLIGMNTPCIIEKNVCEQLMPFQYADTWEAPRLGSSFYKRLTISTFVANPLSWYQEKARVFKHLWFDGEDYFGKMPRLKKIQYLSSLFLLGACLTLSMLAAVRLYKKMQLGELSWFSHEFLFLFFVLFNILVFTFAHYEQRYSVPLKWVTYLYLLVVTKNLIGMLDQKFVVKNNGVNA